MNQAGRWIAEDRGLYDLSGQDVSASAYLPSQELQRNIQPCPLYPITDIARIDWTSLFRVFPFLKLEIHR